MVKKKKFLFFFLFFRFGKISEEGCTDKRTDYSNVTKDKYVNDAELK